jgi:hypothetical protein
LAWAIGGGKEAIKMVLRFHGGQGVQVKLAACIQMIEKIPNESKVIL